MATGKVALVLEGGGFRGQFTTGALDVLMENGLDQFGAVFGVSAGAIAAADPKSRQIGRGCRDVLAFRDDRRFMSLFSLATTGSITGNEFLYHEVQDELDPFDYATFNANPMRMFAVATDVDFGTAAYLEVSELPRDIDMVQASASLPALSEAVEIDGSRYLDGGFGDSVPVEAALGLEGAATIEGYEPAERTVVVLTRERGFVKGPYQLQAISDRRYASTPYFVECMHTRPERYMAQRERIWELEREGRALVICPDRPIETSVTEANGQRLLELYPLGRKETERQLDAIRAFLG